MVKVDESSKVGRICELREEADRLQRKLTLEEALEDAPNLVKFLRRRHERTTSSYGTPITIEKVEVDDDPMSRLKIESVVISLGISIYFGIHEGGIYKRITDERGIVCRQVYQDFICDSDGNPEIRFELEYSDGKRIDTHRRTIPFP